MNQPRETLTDSAYPDALPAGHRLHWYVLERVLGQGGFGITYLARDTNLDRLVAVKEYLPCDVAQRHSGAMVRPRTEALGARYGWGLERFIAEARTLARFDHANIVRVYSVFEANDTAYMVMRFEEGDTLACLLERQGTLPEADLLRVLLPILDGLELVHGAGFIHRDIKPQNILIRRDGSPVLLDFGSARQSLESPRTMTILVAPGYAPLEQYYGEAGVQGPWTDIYGLAATCYRAVTGQAPVDAIVRIKGVLGSTRDVLEPASSAAKGRYAGYLLAAIDHGLELSERDRPQSLAAWRRELMGEAVPEAGARAQLVKAEPQGAGPALAEDQARPETPRSRTRSARSRMYRAQALWAFAGGAMAAALAVGVFLWVQGRGKGNPGNVTQPSAAPSESDSPNQKLKPLPDTIVADNQASGDMTVPQSSPKSTPPLPSTKRSPSLPETSAEKQPAPPAPAKPKPPEMPVNIAAQKPPPKPVPPPEAPTAPVPPVSSQGDNSRANLESLPKPPEPPAKPTLEDRLKAAQDAMKRGDYESAKKTIEPLAHAGEAQAQELLGRLYEDGHGVLRNPNQAYMWYSLAARQGDEAARVFKQRVAWRLQPAEIRQADKLVDGWQPESEVSGSQSK